MAVRLVLHVLLCITLIVATPIAQFGMTIKTILTLLFKVNNVFFMIKLKSAKNISGNDNLRLTWRPDFRKRFMAPADD